MVKLGNIEKVIETLSTEDREKYFSEEIEKDAIMSFKNGDVDKLLRGEDVPNLTNKYLE